MRHDLYQHETERLAHKQSLMLDEARLKLEAGQALGPLEQGGVLHALQLLTENAIGKAKHILKAKAETVPVSAYDAFESLVRIGILPIEELAQWNAVIGIRNRIVHEYMNIDMNVIFELVKARRHQFIVEFLMRPIEIARES
jgi:uncharacterized protein YutE (UPF0331/DUF86 family)